SLALSVDENRLLAGDDAGNLTLWNLQPPATQTFAQPAPPEKSVPLAVLSPDRSLLAAAGRSGEQPAIVVTELATGNVLHTLLGHEAPPSALAFSSDSTRLVSGSPDGTARVWSLADAKFPELARF